MGLKDFVFVGLCVLGAGAVGGMLLRQERVERPQEFWPGRFGTTNVATSRDKVFPPAQSPTAGSNDWEPVLAKLNNQFRISWEQNEVEVADKADDLVLARRLSLALAGTIPSLEEIRSFEKISESQRLEWWVSHLLEDRRFCDYFAERLARVYVGTDNGPAFIFRRRRFVAWLSDQLHEKKPYDQIVRELISDKGLWTGEPAVNFITVTINADADDKSPDEIRLAGRVARGFLGVRIDCLQCHDDKLGNITLGDENAEQPGQQTHFHELAAFFGQTENSFAGIRDNQDRKYEYTYLNAEEETVVKPAVPFAEACFTGEGTLRQQLATWVTSPENKAFSRATVNRVWALMFGRPLVDPIDNIPLHGDLPPVLTLLADDFVEHGYDLRRLIRLIAATEAYQRDSEADFEITVKHEHYWAAFPLTRLRPEQVAGSIVQASWLQTIDADSHVIQQLTKFGQTNDFVTRYGDLGQDEFQDRGGTITQRLLLMNGELVKERLDDKIATNAATRLAALCARDDKLVDAVYLSVLTRRPSDEEKSYFLERLQGKQGEFRRQAIADLYWVLLNSTEFSWNH